MKDRAHQLYQQLHGHAPEASLVKKFVVRVPEKLTGMGKLQWLEVARDGRIEQWDFRRIEPRLCFGALTDTDRGRSTLWILGGSYRITPQGFREVRGASGLRRTDLAKASKTSSKIVEKYERTHGGRAPVEALESSLSVPDVVVPIGHLYAVCYDADKGDGTYPYRHPFALTAQPLLCCDASGSQLLVVGGRYTVTPHGIEDGT